MAESRLKEFFQEAQEQYPFRFLYDNLYTALSRLIVLEYAAPGERLNDSDIAGQLNISRTPVRRAFYALQEDGLLEYLDVAAYRVPLPDRQKLIEIMVFRQALEPPIAYSAAKNATDSDPADLWRIMQEYKCLDCSKEFSREENELAFQIEANFHKKICDMCVNTYLRKTYYANLVPISRSLFNNCNRRRLKPGELDGISKDAAYQDHLQIYSSLKYRNGRMAMEAVFSHLHKATY